MSVQQFTINGCLLGTTKFISIYYIYSSVSAADLIATLNFEHKTSNVYFSLSSPIM